MKDWWIVLPRGRFSKWETEQLTPAQAFNRGNQVLAMAGPYRSVREAAEAQRDAESQRILSFAKSRLTWVVKERKQDGTTHTHVLRAEGGAS